jgi:hypothetical protein
MAKKKLFEDIKAQPGRFYRLPGDVTRDRRFSDDERLEILLAWAREADAARGAQIEEAIADIRRRLTSNDHAAE